MSRTLPRERPAAVTIRDALVGPANRDPRGPSVDDRVALLAEELPHVVHREAGLAGRARALPAAERLDARPRTGGRAGAAVDVQHARVDLLEEALDLGAILGVAACGQALRVVVREAERLVEVVDRRDR